jgi:hypothetical protein
LTVQTEPEPAAVINALFQLRQLVPPSHGNGWVVPDYAWDRFNEGMERIEFDVLTRESEQLYRRYQWENCDAIARAIVEAFGRSEADPFRPSDAVSPRRRGW